MELRVKIDEIKDQGLVLDRELKASDLEDVLTAEPPTGFHARGPLPFKGRLDRVGETDILFSSDFKAPVKTECRRCLGEATLDAKVSFRLELVKDVPESPGATSEEDDDEAAERAGSFDPDDADLIPYSGHDVDLWPTVREQILLALPMDALCRDDCKGLCQICGKNWNDETCACERKIPDPRFAVLKDVKLD